ncbi:hypothetical protein Tco_1466248 [Tanacetum coccineum]
MMTVRKRVGPLPTHRLAVRHSASTFLQNHIKASSDFHSDASSDPSSRHPLSDHSSPDLPSTSAGPSRKRRREFGILVIRQDVGVNLERTYFRDDAIAVYRVEARVVDEDDDRDETDGCRKAGEAELRGLRILQCQRIFLSCYRETVEATYKTLGDLVQRFHDHAQTIPSPIVYDY